jgi:ABC-type Fe3+/spermidine/putrescine transport system ATPase subunit
MPNIRVEGVTKRFGNITALEEVNLEIHDGEYVTILGPSGCGKTTLIKIIAGIWPPSDGHILIDGQDLTYAQLEERDLGYVFQNIMLFPNMNVKDNAGYSPRVKGKNKESVEAESREALELVGMLQQMGFFPNELSGGAQQKAALARALASKSKLLLLDEPLSALDARVRVDLRYELRRLVKDLGLTAIHVTHDQEEAMSVADRVVVMRKGQIVEVGEPRQLYDSPRNLFTANFVGQSNFLEGTVRNLGEGATKVEVRGGKYLSVGETGHSPGSPVVLAIRPERLKLRPDDTANSIWAKLVESRFMGSFIRHSLQLENGDEVLADLLPGESRPKLGTSVSVYFNPDHVRVYSRPREGLSEALRLE